MKTRSTITSAKPAAVRAGKSQSNKPAKAERLKEIKALAPFAALESIQKPKVIFEHQSRAGAWSIFHARDADGRDLFLHQRPAKEGEEGKFEAIDADQASGMIALAAMPDCLKDHIAGLLLRALLPKGGAR